MLPDTIENVLPRAAAWQADGRSLCLATLVYVAGSAPRPLGSQMVVAGDGAHFGYLSGGCAEHAIAAIGRATIASATATVARFGTDSPYLDVQLPCGSGLDIHYAPGPTPDAVEAVLAALAARETATLDIDVATGAASVGRLAAACVSGAFRRIYYPPTRLIVVGAGPVAVEIARLATLQHMLVTLLTPDQDTAMFAGDATATLLRDERQLDAVVVDRHTAVVTAFHEHEREFAVWRRFAASTAFYLGALGSARSHEARCRELAAGGVDTVAISRIRGPAGIATGGKTAAEIALSIVAELNAVYRQQALPELIWDGGPLTSHARRADHG